MSLPDTYIREGCLQCVLKHLMQAGILMLEYRKSDPEEYPLHPYWANAHLAEAEDELMSFDTELSKTIRINRLQYLSNRNFQIPIEGFALAILEKLTEDKETSSSTKQQM